MEMKPVTLNLQIHQDGSVSGSVVGSEAAGSNGGKDVVAPGSVLPFPQTSVGGNGTRFYAKDLAQGVYYAFGGAAAAGPKKLSWAMDSGGYPAYHGFDMNKMQRDGTGGTGWLVAPHDGSDWVYYIMYTADPGRVQDGHIDVLDV